MQIPKLNLDKYTYHQQLAKIYEEEPMKTCKDCKSCITGLDFSRTLLHISKEEYLGEWTIEGVYEDESEGE